MSTLSAALAIVRLELIGKIALAVLGGVIN